LLKGGAVKSSIRIVVGGVFVALAGCDSEVVKEAASEFPVGTPLLSSTWVDREYVGKVEAVRHVELRSRLKGFIEQLGVDEGQSVKAGQLLFSISARELGQEVKKARAAIDVVLAELEAAKVEQRNSKLLLEKNLASQTEFDLATAKVAALNARLEEARAHEGQAQINLSYGQLRAPFDGVVNRIPRKLGSMVSEDELLTTLTDTQEVFVYFRLSEQEYLDTTATSGPPRTVSLKLANGTAYPEEGTVDAVETEFDESTGNLALRARFNNRLGLLKHGSTGKVVVRTELGRTLVVPQAATFEIQELLYVYTLDAEDRARATRIVPRARLEDAFVIESGVTENNRIVLEGVHKVKEGAVVTIRSSEGTTRAASR
jgi:membrane fusion protein (multidrug efflux system)